MKERTVFVPNRSNHNFKPAEKFGNLIFLTEGILDPADINNFARIASDAFHNSSPEDYILLSGLTSLCMVMSAVFAAKHNQVNVLVWRNGHYIERTITDLARA